jgi:hypothetical protein
MWRKIRIGALLLVLAYVAFSSLYDRNSTTDWDETLWIGVYPINADGSAATASYVAQLTPSQLAPIEAFLNREAHRYGIAISRPVRVDLYPRVAELPPQRAEDSGMLGNVAWSLKLRLYARRAANTAGRPPPQIRVFVLFHDPASTQAVPHSIGLQKGLVGVVHAFAERAATPTNNVVIAHEILHTLGASDKYDAATLAPFPELGYADPGQRPLLPQVRTEIMAGRRAISSTEFEMPESLEEVVVGKYTALEIRWRKP